MLFYYLYNCYLKLKDLFNKNILAITLLQLQIYAKYELIVRLFIAQIIIY